MLDKVTMAEVEMSERETEAEAETVVLEREGKIPPPPMFVEIPFANRCNEKGKLVIRQQSKFLTINLNHVVAFERVGVDYDLLTMSNGDRYRITGRVSLRINRLLDEYDLAERLWDVEDMQ